MRTEKDMYNDLYNYQQQNPDVISQIQRINLMILNNLAIYQPLYIIIPPMGQCIAQKKSCTKIQANNQSTCKVVKANQLQSLDKFAQNQIYQNQGISSNKKKKEIQVQKLQSKSSQFFQKLSVQKTSQNYQNICINIEQNKCNGANQSKDNILSNQIDNNNPLKNASETSSMNQSSKIFTPKKWQKVKKKQHEKGFKQSNVSNNNLKNKENKYILSQKQIEAEKRIKNILDLNSDISRKYGLINQKLNEKARNIK